MPKLPKVAAHQVMKVIASIGFSVTRETGTHRLYRNQEGKRITLPARPGKMLHPKILENILEDAELPVKEFLELLGE